MSKGLISTFNVLLDIEIPNCFINITVYLLLPSVTLLFSALPLVEGCHSALPLVEGLAGGGAAAEEMLREEKSRKSLVLRQPIREDEALARFTLDTREVPVLIIQLYY